VFRNRSEARGWLAGVIDSEGSVSMRPLKGRGFVRDVRVTNTDGALLDRVAEVLDSMGVSYTVYDRSDRARLGSKPISDLVVTGKSNLEKLLVLSLVTEKGDKLREALDSYIRLRKPPMAELAEMMTTMSDREIGVRYGVTKGAVQQWRVGYGLKRRG
jgi:intein/homing endonuclease